MTTSDDDALLMRLRDLSLVDLDALLAGAGGDAYADLVITYALDLEDALRAARSRAGELLRILAGTDPLAQLDTSPAARARDGGREAAERTSRRLTSRAQAARALGRLDDLTASLYPKLIEADRRRVGL
ncbi:MAG TPA: hypothetical protein VHE35_26770 [Kofleriaceae bacterium]|nr:hypothetical protein [Kofleriaceae bacterium]